MKQILITAMHSGAGKTVITCALLAALKKRGVDVHAFKCGPDYIDPMFHTEVLGVPSRNLDLFLQGIDAVRSSVALHGGELAVLEGAMGYYDGVNGSDGASAWAVADVLACPAVLVVRPQGNALTLAAQIKGLQAFRPESHLAGVLFNGCKESLASFLKHVIERETGLPVLGFLPPMEEAALESRHLGLLTAGEIEDLSARFSVLSEQLEKTVDLDALLDLAGEYEAQRPEQKKPRQRCTIAVAKDEAFCFTYADSLDALRNAGAELVFFSPVRDQSVPEGANGLYLCGGYPELHARQLSENTAMRQSICSAVSSGMPTVAECGGFLYLQQTLEDVNGDRFPMCGALPGAGFRTNALQRFGYLWLTAEEDSLLFRKGERIPAHEFHYWDCTENGSDLLAEKPNGKTWRYGFVGKTLYAAFPHLHLGGELPLSRRFAEACVKYADA